MRKSPFCLRTFPVLLTVLFATSFCYADQKSVQVIGTSECADCHVKNIKHSDAFKGLKVSIDCKLENGEMKRRAEGKLDEEGKFAMDIPRDLLDNENKLKEECYAQLHGSSNLPCPAHDGLESTKLSFVSETNGKHTFTPVKNLKFSSETCASEFLWPFFKHPWFKKPWFKKPYVIIPKFKKPYCPPVYKKPIYTPSVPVYKEPSYNPPVYKPTPSVPVYKKPSYYPPVYKKPTPSAPVYKKPSYYPPVYKKPTPSAPVYKKPSYYPPVYKKPTPSTPVYKEPSYNPPVYTKPTPSVPIYKKPCPDITIPKIDPKVFIHPKFKKWPFFPPKP